VNWRWVEEGDGYVGPLQPPGQPLGVGLPIPVGCTNRLYNSSGSPLPWAAPGAWSDCQNSTLFQFDNVAPGSTGTVTKTAAISPAAVESWIANPAGNTGGAAEMGFKAGCWLDDNQGMGISKGKHQPQKHLMQGTVVKLSSTFRRADVLDACPHNQESPALLLCSLCCSHPPAGRLSAA
jgi:hypothetical protein